MTAPICSFARALAVPSVSLPEMDGAEVECDKQGMPLITRTTRFAECMIRWRGARWLLALPLQEGAVERIERTVSRLGRLRSTNLAEYRVIPRALHWHDATGTPHRSDVVIQRLPEGICFAEAVERYCCGTVLAAIDALERCMEQMHFVHNNIKAENLLWSHGRLIPLRYHDAAVGKWCRHDNDRKAFEELRREVRMRDNRTGEETEPCTEEPCRRLAEGLMRTERDGLTGFENEKGEETVPPRYRWADDFCEGRAVVATDDGYGAIDCEGHEIIATEYEIVEYDTARSLFYVRRNGRWATFDWCGKRLTRFQSRHCPEFDKD